MVLLKNMTKKENVVLSFLRIKILVYVLEEYSARQFRIRRPPAMILAYW